MTTAEYIFQIHTETGAEALSALCIQAKTLQGKEDIRKYLSFETLAEAAHDPSPKKRKNAYRLIGLLSDAAYLSVLRDALQNEKTLFAIPSLLLSLGALKDYETLSTYVPPVSENCTMDKHVAEITLALKKALQSSNKSETSATCKLEQLTSVLCYPPEGFNTLLAEELRSLGYAVVTEKGCCRIMTSDLSNVFKANCLSEALIPIEKNVNLSPESILKALPVMPKEAYRIELRGFTKDRRKLINSLSGLLGGINNPSAYSWELRIDCRGEVADLFWKPCKVEDRRYPWRKRTLSASINPALAACLAAYTKKLNTVPNPSILDPFCGSGSLLFSLETEMKCRSLMGVDKSSTAVEAARENALAGKSKAFFVTKDILRFESRNGFDIVISNMPFGLRVGNHDINKDLYTKFLKKLPGMLSQKGFAVLYTMEYKLLQNCIEQAKGLRVVEKLRTEAGGLLPWIFVIDKE